MTFFVTLMCVIAIALVALPRFRLAMNGRRRGPDELVPVPVRARAPGARRR